MAARKYALGTGSGWPRSRTLQTASGRPNSLLPLFFRTEPIVLRDRVFGPDDPGDLRSR